jgi:hypothetical protein
MQESGTKPHPIKPRKAKALAFPGAGRKGRGFAMAAAHPGTGGHKAWSKAGERLQQAIDPVVTDAYDEALGA